MSGYGLIVAIACIFFRCKTPRVTDIYKIRQEIRFIIIITCIGSVFGVIWFVIGAIFNLFGHQWFEIWRDICGIFIFFGM